MYKWPIYGGGGGGGSRGLKLLSVSFISMMHGQANVKVESAIFKLILRLS